MATGAGNTRVRSDWSGGDLVFYDRASGVEIKRIGAGRTTQLAAAAVGVVTAGTISGTTNAGAAPTVTVTDCTDLRGSFLLNPVTGGGGQTAGKVATVRYATPLPVTPACVVINVTNETDGTVVAGFGVLAADVNGFDIYTALLVTAKAYRVFYNVYL
jgi:hypothetical protein